MKTYARTRVSISWFASNLLPSPNFASSSSRFSNVISNGGFYELQMVLKDDPLVAKIQPFKDKVKVQNIWNRVAPKKSWKKVTNYMGKRVAAAMEAIMGWLWQPPRPSRHGCCPALSLVSKMRVLCLALDCGFCLVSAVLGQLGLVC